MSAPISVAALLAPMSLDTFLGTVWGRRHHHGAATAPDRFAGLLTDRRLEEILATCRPQPDMLGLVKDGQTLPFGELLLPDGMVDMVQLRNRYAEGHSIVVNGLERFAPELRPLANAFASELDFEAQLNLYATPPNARGFAPHFDDHDVLVLQMHGRKTWHVHLSTPLVSPERFRERERAVDHSKLGEPERIVMAPGDILYLPRGRIHAAETGEGASVHLTIGLHPPTFATLLSTVLEARGVKGGALLDRLPPRYLSDRETRAGLAATVRELAAALEDADVEAGLIALEDRLIRSGRGAATGDFLTADPAALTGETMLHRSASLRARLAPLGNAIGLQFAQAIVVAEPDHRPAFEFLLDRQEAFRVADLPGLEPEARLALAEKLIQDGFLVPA